MDLSEKYESLINPNRAKSKEMIMDAVRERKTSGEFRRDLSVEITGMAIVGMVNWTYKWYKKSGAKTIEDIGEIYINLILHALLDEETLFHNGYENVLI